MLNNLTPFAKKTYSNGLRLAYFAALIATFRPLLSLFLKNKSFMQLPFTSALYNSSIVYLAGLTFGIANNMATTAISDSYYQRESMARLINSDNKYANSFAWGIQGSMLASGIAALSVFAASYKLSCINYSKFSIFNSYFIMGSAITAFSTSKLYQFIYSSIKKPSLSIQSNTESELIEASIELRQNKLDIQTMFNEKLIQNTNIFGYCTAFTLGIASIAYYCFSSYTNKFSFQIPISPIVELATPVIIALLMFCGDNHVKYHKPITHNAVEI